MRVPTEACDPVAAIDADPPQRMCQLRNALAEVGIGIAR